MLGYYGQDFTYFHFNLVPNNLLPTFLGIGVSRSGTTALHAYMQRHNNIFVPDRKEIHYFTFNSERCGARSPMTPADYRKYFSTAENYAVRGEISPSYLWVPETAAQISSLLPSVKLVVILRNPVERAISDFQYSWQFGLNQVDFSDFVSTGIRALQAGQLTLSPFHPAAVIWKGCYSRLLGDYLDIFEHRNIKILLFDDMIENPSNMLADLCAYLGVPYDPASHIPKTNARPESRSVEDSAREMLLEFYRADVTKLAKMLNKNLDHWLS